MLFYKPPHPSSHTRAQTHTIRMIQFAISCRKAKGNNGVMFGHAVCVLKIYFNFKISCCFFVCFSKSSPSRRLKYSVETTKKKLIFLYIFKTYLDQASSAENHHSMFGHVLLTLENTEATISNSGKDNH